MQQFKDIHETSAPEDITIWNTSTPKDPTPVSPFISGIDDISDTHPNDIDIQPEYTIKIGKKRGKYFDALEKSNNLFGGKKLLPVDIRNKNYFSFVPYRLAIQRYIKKLWWMGMGLTMMFVFIVCVILSYVDKLIIENRVNAGYQNLIEIKEWNLSLEQIQKKVNNARFDLLVADILFLPFQIFPWDKIQSIWHVISWGRYLSRWLDDTLSLYDTLKKFTTQKPIHKIYFTHLFTNISSDLQHIEKMLQKAIDQYQAIAWLPNNSLQETLAVNLSQIENIVWYLTTLNENMAQFLDIFGHTEKKKYLVLFQNSDEIRPTWWFIGSIGVLEIFRWRVDLFQKKDVYAVEWDLKQAQYERLPAPKGIAELTDTFWLRDANYYVNLQDSSKAIKFFTDKSGIDIDGIMYINQNVIIDLLKITWPVYFPELDMYISADNFSTIMSLMVEAKTFKQGTLGTPKQILFDFMEIFSQTLIEKWEYFEYLQTLVSDMENRNIMMWSFDPEENQFLSDIWANGNIAYDTTLDFTYPVYTSISGNKSDRYMYRKYRQTVRSGESCSYDIAFEIQSTHNMTKNEREYITNMITENDLTTPNLFEIQWAGTNRQFVRVIIPDEAILEPQEWVVEILYGERKWAEFFLETQLQETSFFTLKYQLPNHECKPYTYELYKQPGIPLYDITMDIDGDTYTYTQQQQDFYFEKRDN